MEYYRNVRLSQEMEEAASKVQEEVTARTKKPNARWNCYVTKAKTKRGAGGGVRSEQDFGVAFNVTITAIEGEILVAVFRLGAGHGLQGVLVAR